MEQLSGVEKIDIAAKYFKSFVADNYLDEGIKLLLISLKVTPGGFLASIVTKIIMMVVDRLYPIMIKFIKVQDIKLENKVHQAAWEKVQYKLKVLAIEGGIDSPAFEEARKKEHEKFSKAVKLNIAYI